MRIGAYLALAGVLSLPACAGAQPGGWGYGGGSQYYQPRAQYAPEYRPYYAPQPFVGGRDAFYGRELNRREWDRREYGRGEERRQQEVVRQQQQYNQRLLQQQQQYNATVLKQQQYNNALLQQQQAYNAAKLAQERAAGR